MAEYDHSSESSDQSLDEAEPEILLDFTIGDTPRLWRPPYAMSQHQSDELQASVIRDMDFLFRLSASQWQRLLQMNLKSSWMQPPWSRINSQVK